ncbi:fumarylacetoacetate hydrolase family protein [Limnohabitans sp. JirII-31]|uniref:fumarylacetoacetate hydrolase family protein n=1 Tax=Limnohabitans sp. JirII-31 TaxID=1977908 RepID=UPI000C1E8A9A|nr:fumarylacetoacetate hydrolase family protein [Limnohabitans sp. JirII-31]PIT75177.1 5-carboxymethyl-2-hydroxymuconate isomerase [Limnohabitans sp. JirII-31]
MKLISFLLHNTPSYGIVQGDDVLNLTPILGAQAPDLKSLIANNMLDQAAKALANHKPDLKFADLHLLPVITNPNKIVCVGLNYADHVRETGRELTESPALFLRVSESQVGHGQNIVRPPESHRLDYEGEIAVVIGKGGRRISEADSWSHIAGYSCYNDGSIRDWQVSTTQWTAGKNFWRTGGFGPWMVTADEIKPDQKMTLITRLNGQELQRATTDMMIHSIPRQIAYISTFIPLEAGDVIVTGTPGGVGNKRSPQVFMKPGDVVEIEVDAVGILRNGIVDDVAA